MFASTYEEAKCLAPVCKLTFLDNDQLPTVEAATAGFDTASGKHFIEVTGFNIADTTPATIQAFIGGIEQAVVGVTPTSVLIEVTDVASGDAAKLEVYFEVGAPNDFWNLWDGVDLDPQFLGLETSTVSQCGSIIYA